MKVQFRFTALVLAMLVGASSLVAAPSAWAQVRSGSLEEDLFDSVRNKDMNGVRAALNAGADVFATDILGNRAADVAVDLGQFDIAHYLLTVMDRRSAAAKDAAKVVLTPPPSTVQTAPVTPTVTPPVAAPIVAPPPVVAAPRVVPQPAPAASKQIPSQIPGPNPFAVNTPPRSLSAAASPPAPTVVSLSKPQLRMAGAKPSTPASVPAAPLATPEREPQSTLHIQPGEATQKPTDPTASATPATPATPAAPVGAPALPASAFKAATPTATPAPEQRLAAAEEPGWFSKMTSFFSSDEVDEPAAAPTPAATPAAIPPTEPTRAPQQAEVAALTAPVKAAPVAPSSPGASKRDSIVLTAALALGKAPPPKPAALPADSMQLQADWPCVSKGHWGIVCLEQARWPDAIGAHFDTVHNTLYRGRKAVVGYENDRADFFYVVFNSSGFKDIVAAFSQRLGPPDLVSQRQIKPFQKLLEVNPVRSWFARDPQTGREMVLEISMFEDQASTFPVMDEGAIKLTYVDEDSVFRYLSPMELQRFN
ncbi:hypothetical protein [Magnetovibrio sp.]|uniref:hypothetical protein n=1 Tax=Magnetovibrio sp. TaxID=2024836 RepID=UPI002F94DE7E